MELEKYKCLLLTFCVFIMCNTSTVVVESSNTSDLSVLQNIFKPIKDMNCITDYGVKVSDHLNQFVNNEVKNTTKLCFLIKGSLSDGQSLNHINLSALSHLPKLQQLWILPDHSSSEVHKNLINYIDFNNQGSGGTSMIHLKQIHIETTLWNAVISLNKFLQASTKLEVLHLAKLHHSETIEDMRRILSGVKLTSLKALSFAGMLDNVISLTAVNLSHMFEHLQAEDLEYLDLSRNSIHVIYGSVTAMWPKLRILDISYNMLGRAYGDPALMLDVFMLHQKLEIVYCEGQNPDKIRDEANINNYVAKNGINTKKLSKRDLQRDFITDQSLSFCMKEYNTTINELISAAKSMFCDILYCVTQRIPHLMNLAYFPCRVFPSFKFIWSNLDFSGNCDYNFRFPLAPSLSEIYLGHFGETGRTDFQNSYVNICFQQNKVKTLSLPSISKPTDSLLIDAMFMKYYSFSNVEVENLDLSDNKLHAPLINPGLTSFKHLTMLNLAHNFISLTGNETLYTYFPFMEKLDISYNNISTEDISANLFTNAVAIHDLNLAGNKLKTLSLKFKSAENLTNLNISGNEITLFELQTINDLISLKQQGSVLRIDLRNNKLKCGCSLEEISTVDLIKNAGKYHIEFIDSNLYTCYNQNTTRLLLDIDMSQYKLNCNYPHLTLILSIILSNVVLLVSILSSVMCYKYRYRLLTKFLRIKWRKQERNDKNENYAFDAFVLFSSEDRFWVHNILVERLEGKYGFKLCIHYRDFMAGCSIFDEIEKKINSSKVIIVVLSSNSLKSGWCDHELKTAYTHHIETGKKLVIIKLGKIVDQDELVTPFIKSILQSNVYVNWPEETETCQRMNQPHVVEDKKMLFWVQIANSLYDRDVSCCLLCKTIGPRILQSASEQDMSDARASGDGIQTERYAPERLFLGNTDYNNQHEQNIHVSISEDSELLLP